MDKVIAELKRCIPVNHIRVQEFNIESGSFTCGWMWLKGINCLELIDDEYIHKSLAELMNELMNDGLYNTNVLLEYIKMGDEIWNDLEEVKTIEKQKEEEWKADIILNKELELGINTLWDRTKLYEDVIGVILSFL